MDPRDLLILQKWNFVPDNLLLPLSLVAVILPFIPILKITIHCLSVMEKFLG